MKALEKISDFFGKYRAFIVLAVAALALFAPDTCLWVQTSWVNYLLMVVMFGMGLTLKLEDFKLVFTRPKDIIAGCMAQFTIMPLLAWLLGKAFHLDPALMAGVVLVGTCPGGTSSNVITYLSKGDVPLSVGMTSVNTLLAPFLTPAITYLLLRTTVTVDMVSMFMSIVQVVIVPIALGFIINKMFGKATQKRFRNRYLSDCSCCCISQCRKDYVYRCSCVCSSNSPQPVRLRLRPGPGTCSGIECSKDEGSLY